MISERRDGCLPAGQPAAFGTKKRIYNTQVSVPPSGSDDKALKPVDPGVHVSDPDLSYMQAEFHLFHSA